VSRARLFKPAQHARLLDGPLSTAFSSSLFDNQQEGETNGLNKQTNCSDNELIWEVWCLLHLNMVFSAGSPEALPVRPLIQPFPNLYLPSYLT